MPFERLDSDQRIVTERELRSTFAEYVSLDPWPPVVGTPLRRIVSSPLPGLVTDRYTESGIDGAKEHFAIVTGSPLPEDPSERAEMLARIHPRADEGMVELKPGQWRVVVEFPRTRVVLFASAHDESEFDLLRSRLRVMNTPPSSDEREGRSG